MGVVMHLDEIIRLCYQCGACTGICPMRRVSLFSPRDSILNSRGGDMDPGSVAVDTAPCLTCYQCAAECPQGIDFPEYVLASRCAGDDSLVTCAVHGTVLHEIQEIMASADKGIPKEFAGETDDGSDIAYYPGCIDYLNLFYDDVGVDYHAIGDASVNLLNKMGVKPRILDMKCCGHDALYQGDKNLFERLSAYNTKRVKNSGIKTIVVSCAECYMMFKKHYELENVNVLHISEFLDPDKLEIKTESDGGIVTYHDPCRLGRYCGVYDAPRKLIKYAGAEFVDMKHNREKAVCCGVSAWLNCNDCTKALRAMRLDEAKKIGAETMITACTKCLTHFNCLKNEIENNGVYDMKIEDFTVFIANKVGAGK